MADVSGPVLVTGGLGYVGGRVAAHLRAAHPALPIRLLTRKHGPVPTWATEHDVVRGDVLDRAALRAAADGTRCVLHFAAANEILSANDPAAALDITTKGTLHALQAAQDAGCARFVYMSTFRVYDSPAGDVVTEATPPGPLHPYGITHLAAEHLVGMFRARGKMETLVLRLSNAYGAPMDLGVDRWTLVFNDLCRQAARDGRLKLASSGKPQRDFVSLEDVGRAISHFLGMPAGHWRAPVLNLGGERSMSILELASVIAAVYRRDYGAELPITTGSGDDPRSWQPVRFSIDALKATGFTPRHNLEEEVARTLRLCKAD